MDKVQIGRKGEGVLKEYRECAREVRKVVKGAIKNHELDIPKLLYSYINNRQQTNDVIRSLGGGGEDGENVTEKEEITRILNRQFESVFIMDEEDVELPEFNRRTDKTYEVDKDKMLGLEVIVKRLGL